MATQQDKDLAYPELSYAIVGAAMRVHKALGPGLPEAAYQKALAGELARSEIPFVPEAAEGGDAGGSGADLLVDHKVVLEPRAVAELSRGDVSAAHASLQATGARLAIIVNFGRRQLETRRVVVPRQDLRRRQPVASAQGAP
jgi:GxxExxY protein